MNIIVIIAAIMALLLLTALVLSVLQVIFMILGWYRIKHGAPEQCEDTDDDDTDGEKSLPFSVTVK